jgi:oxaloacetate decarboxylase (Na+ extruding) subunit gamma
MSDAALLKEGVYLMLFGMGFVVIFLQLLVYAVQIMSSLIKRFTPDLPSTALLIEPVGPKASSPDDALIQVVIAAALHHHRTHDKK